MNNFFNQAPGQSIEWFGLTHILIIITFIVTLLIVILFGKKLAESKYERHVRFFLIILVFLFEWRVFENRALNLSILRLPLCAIALYGLTYAIALKKEKIFKISYFYWFGTILTFLFFDTPFGLDRWSGWKYFGAHLMIGVLAMYGLSVFKWIPTKKDLFTSMNALAIYATLSGYATFQYGGSDELFLKTPPVDFLNGLVDIHQVVYTSVFVLVAATIMILLYLPFIKYNKKTKGKNLTSTKRI
jgi:uncharacterized membrane protein YwaF